MAVHFLSYFKNEIFSINKNDTFSNKHNICQKPIKPKLEKQRTNMSSISKTKLETWNDFVALTAALRLPIYDISDGKKEVMKIRRMCDNTNHSQPFEALKTMLVKAQIRFWVEDNSIFDYQMSIHIVFPITKQTPYAQLAPVVPAPEPPVQVPQVNRNELFKMAKEGGLAGRDGPDYFEIFKYWYDLDQAIPFYNMETYLCGKGIPFSIQNSGDSVGSAQYSTIVIGQKHLVD